MNNELAQLVALTSHGNRFLSGALDEPPELVGSNLVFIRNESVEFHFSVESPRTVRGTAAWFRELRDRGVNRLTLVVAQTAGPDDAAFSGGADWFVRSAGERVLDWRGRYAFLGHGRPKPWSVQYVGGRADAVEPALVTLVEATSELVRALNAAEDLSRRARLGYIGIFERARRTLEARRRPSPGRYADLLPAGGFRSDAGQLLLGAIRAWVFGGMGSWNDIVIEDDALDAEYNRVTVTLWRSVISAIVTATNALE